MEVMRMVCLETRAKAGAALAAALCAALFAAPLLAAAPAAAAPWDPPRAFPAKYDLRDHSRVSPVRKQGHYGTCWVHAALGSLESNLLPAASPDLSENHLADFQASRLRYEGRAPSAIAIAYVARWEGPVLERDDPYPRPGGSPEGLTAIRHVQEVLMLPSRSDSRDNAAIKWAVMEHGAVDTAMAYESSAFSARTSAYYSRTTDLDHHVCVVGWDDGFPAGRFLRRPPGPGAFLVKNSWGREFGRQGYFWVSYHDRMFGRRPAVFNGIESAVNHDAVYQHDTLGWSRGIGFGTTTAWFAARYTSGGDGRVTAVSFYTPVPGALYEVRVAGSLAGIGSAPVAGQGTIAVGGYHTVRLTSPAPVADGGDFVAAVRLTTPGSRTPVPVEHPTDLIAPRAAAGRSFVSRDGGTWSDLRARPGFGRSDVCLKAFVTSDAAGDRAAPTVTLEGAEARPGSTARVRFTVNDPPFSSGSAVVRLWLRDARGRTVRTARVPGVAVNEREVWCFAAPARRGAYRVVARAWDVTGHRQATLSRAVLRVR